MGVWVEEAEMADRLIHSLGVRVPVEMEGMCDEMTIHAVLGGEG